ncbi:methyltransferase [Cellulosimicrobium cellulans]|uniref:methyltransferase n=1 Tax=Cellulosimicrobium cellulans TaxID=1710 RepID=UPI00130DDC75|nr:methyltransferase [Cellulosimicrobium cellulans]
MSDVAPTRDRFERVRQALDRAGVTDLYDSLDPWNDFAKTAARLWPLLEPRLHPMLSLLAAGEPITLSAFHGSREREVVDALTAAGVARTTGDLVTLDGLALYRFGGCWLLADRPSGTPTLYFGTDSVGLATRIPSSRGGRALDLCAGPGAQSLVMASHGFVVDAAEINPIACELFALNAELNDLSGMARVRCGDLYAAEDTVGPYDLIVANPPLLPIPAGCAYPFVGDGGPSGLDVALRVIRGAGERLTPDGSALVVCAARVRGFELQDIRMIEAAAEDGDVDVLVTIIQSYGVTPDSAWVHGVAATSLDHRGEAPVDLQSRASDLAALYASDETTGVCSLTLRAWRGQGEVSVQDFSSPDDPGPNPWLIR